MKNNQKGFIVPILLAIMAALVIGGGAYVYKKKKVEDQAAIDTKIQEVNQAKQQIDTKTYPIAQTDVSNWKTYTNSEYNFEFKYPSNLSMDENKGSSNFEKRYTAVYVDTQENINFIKFGEGTEGPETFLVIDAHEPKAKPAGGCGDYSTLNHIIAGIRVTKCLGGDEGSLFGPGSMRISFTQDGLVYFSIRSERYEDNDKKIIDEILSTFKFTK